MVNRGQAHTLEAVTAAFLLVASIGFALQMTAVTPLSASTSSQHLENQLRATAQGVLESSAETGALEDAVLYWNETESQFQNTSGLNYYTETPPDTAFGGALNRSFNERNVAYNVYVSYQTADGTPQRRRMIYSGEPSDHAVRASRAVTLVDDDRLIDTDGTLNRTVANSTTFFAPDAGVESGGNRVLYNHVRVEVVAWRI